MLPKRMFTVIQKLNDDLIILKSGQTATQLWAKTSSIPDANCAIAGKPILGKESWRPLTDVRNCNRCISIASMAKLLKVWKKAQKTR